MATAVIMPKLGNSVESSVIVAWKKAVGDHVADGDILCEVETDKAVMEVPSTISGTLLAILRDVNDEVPVLDEIAVIGAEGDDVSAWQTEAEPKGAPAHSGTRPDADVRPPASDGAAAAVPAADASVASAAASPRARNLAAQMKIDLTTIAGSGPAGRIIERDVIAARNAAPKLTPVAQAMVASGDFALPDQGSGPGGRVRKVDLVSAGAAADAVGSGSGDVEAIPLKGVRKVIAQRMLASLQSTAQLTLNATADARALKTLRARFKSSPDNFGLQLVTVNDLVLFAVARTLLEHPALNALFDGDVIARHSNIHLGIAVDTPRGLLVPVIRNTHALSLRQLSVEAKRLAGAAQTGKAQLHDLEGGTFTVTNLGAFGIESFTPVLNSPQVAILGVGNINLKPVQVDGGDVEFIPHLGLSLTINHQVVDGAPAARFLQTLAEYIGAIDLLLAG